MHNSVTNRHTIVTETHTSLTDTPTRSLDTHVCVPDEARQDTYIEQNNTPSTLCVDDISDDHSTDGGSFATNSSCTISLIDSVAPIIESEQPLQNPNIQDTQQNSEPEGNNIISGLDDDQGKTNQLKENDDMVEEDDGN